MSNRAVVSFCNQRGNYLNGIARLGNSLKGKFDGDFIGFIGEQSLGAPLHQDNPYAFKLYAIERALAVGYNQILWLDASCFAIKNIDPIFDGIEKEGYIMQEAGHYVGTWTNDKTLEYFGITRDEAMNIPCYGNAGFLGLNLEDIKAVKFLSLWQKAQIAGCFKGSWTNENNSESYDDRCKGHRHDLSCGSIIANQLGMKYKSGNEWLEYATPEKPITNETILIRAAGL